MMKITEAIILAGGLGTRLRSAVPDLPKCMAPVAGKPFLSYVIEYYREQGITRFIFSLGYRHDIIISFLEKNYPELDWVSVIENEPLGTGGAIRLALTKAISDVPLILNGDTLFQTELKALAAFHHTKQAICTLSLKPMQHFDRYGVVELNSDACVIAFKEKMFYESGLINGGIYVLDRSSFLKKKWPEKFSFEKDFLEKFFPEKNIYGIIQEGYFIDIGIPEDYNRAQMEFLHLHQKLPLIDKSWTLFLDRDGVINVDNINGYILNWEEFRFYPGVLDAMKIFAGQFGKIILVTNQRGVGKGVMSLKDLQFIHTNMTAAITEAGGRMDALYFCTGTENDDPNRKPNPGMAFQAREKFPEIDFSKSIMVGNTRGDMEFGRNIGAFTVYIHTREDKVPAPETIDARFESLFHLAKALHSR